MMQLIRTELAKVRTTRTNLLVGVGALVVAALLGAANAAVAGSPGAARLGTAAWIGNVVGVSTIPAFVALLLGVLASAGEHQHQTITTTFLVTPRRERAVAAKVVAIGVVGPVLAAGMVAVAVLATVPALLTKGASVDAFHREVATTIVGLLLASSLLGAIGVLLGLLVRSQLAAVVTVAAWLLVLEGVVDTVAGGRLHRWLPGGVAAALAGNGDRPLWLAAALLALWTAGLAAVTVPLVVRRDVQ
jgi:ABC-2 type transport system permease protein